MRKHDVRKWLHAILDLLPVILIPVFMIYSHRHEISGSSVVVPQNQVVDFNQKYKGNGNIQHVGNSTLVQVNDDIIVDVNTDVGNVYFSFALPSLVQDHIYYFKSNGNSSHAYTYLYVDSAYTPIVEDELVAILGGSEISSLVTTASDFIGQFTYKFNIFDVTQMFGAGNEPSKVQFNQWYGDYYDYVDSHKQLLQVGTITYDDTDIMSQATYQLYNVVDKYFNVGNVFHLGEVYDWFNINIFNGQAPIYINVVYQIVLYELVMDLLFLLYALFMWFIDMIQKLMEKPLNSVK